MDTLRGLKSVPVFLVIVVCLFSLYLLPSIGFCDDWVYVGSDKESTQYYNSSSLVIDNQNKKIEVSVKLVFTDKGKINFLEKIDSKTKPKYNDIIYQLKHYIINYKDMKSNILFLSYYNKSDKSLFHREYLPKWINIIPDTFIDKLINNILKDHNIQR